MAKTLDQLVQECIGAQVLQILRMQADAEQAQERIAALEAEAAKAKAPKRG